MGIPRCDLGPLKPGESMSVDERLGRRADELAFRIVSGDPWLARSSMTHSPQAFLEFKAGLNARRQTISGKPGCRTIRP